MAAAGTRSRPAGPGQDVAAQQPGVRRRADDRHGARVGHGGRDGAQADPLDDAQRPGELDRGGTERPPAIVRLRAGQDQQVATLDRASGAGAAPASSGS